MATLYFRVYPYAGATAEGDKIQEGKVTVQGTSTQSSAITGSANERRKVRLWTDTECYVTWGSSPTAKTDGTDGMPLGEKNPEYVDIQAGHKIAVIQRS